MQPQDSCSQEQTSQAKGNQFKDRSWKTCFKYASRLFGVAIFVVAIYVVQNEFKHLSLKNIKDSLSQIPDVALYAAAGCTFLSFLILSFYDKLAVIQVGHRLSFLKTAFASFCSYVLSHNIGFSAVSGAIVRFRLYGSWGLQAIEIVQVIAFCSITYFLGAAVLIGTLFIFKASDLPIIGHELPAYVFVGLGSLCWLLVALYVVISFYCNELKLWKYRFSFPKPMMAIAQIIIATAEVIATAAIPYCVIPDYSHLSGYQSIDFPTFLGVYIASYSAGLIASVPGGVGVFEGSMLLALKPYMPAEDIVSVIFIFRLFYYLIPLFFAGIMFAGHEVFLRGGNALHKNAKKLFVFKLRPISSSVENIRESDAAFSVNIAAATTSLCGLIALALPVLDPTKTAVRKSFSLVIEIAGDYLLSFFGMLLLVLTVALARRITMAWCLSLATLVLLAVVTLLRGAPIYVPIIFTLSAFFIAPFRNCYYRKANFSATPLSLKTAIEILILIVTIYVIIWLSPHHTVNHGIIEIFLSHHVSFEIKSIIAFMVLVGCMILFKMMRPARIRFDRWSQETRELYEVLSNSTINNVVSIDPDAIVIFSTAGTVVPFLRREGMLIGLGDPVGKQSEIINTIWRLRDLATQEHRSLAFWNVSAKYLSIYQDLGLANMSLKKDRYVCCELYYMNYLHQLIENKKCDNLLS
ncbi:Predicted membrane flippase AglD2/YbhN [Commensalibacter communis]|uniref:lysylphosphatidylglycerol synthase domain-containing protein n=1 Tax=Commensalibacter communis TaxID=2972786 RepID=UPI0022FF6B36|nr:lysylphosphatidylglycerol synthase domain-containing protein [Commensalibacter communis]CAI3946665.1 Predicted membrane flippase AglD2/YbhN [Commensalibacter communis]CAI3947980.1 Predicted membrane flippase AglD2/YbhN [Commensalibacter communis]